MSKEQGRQTRQSKARASAGALAIKTNFTDDNDRQEASKSSNKRETRNASRRRQVGRTTRSHGGDLERPLPVLVAAPPTGSKISGQAVQRPVEGNKEPLSSSIGSRPVYPSATTKPSSGHSGTTIGTTSSKQYHNGLTINSKSKPTARKTTGAKKKPLTLKMPEDKQTDGTCDKDEDSAGGRSSPMAVSEEPLVLELECSLSLRSSPVSVNHYINENSNLGLGGGGSSGKAQDVSLDGVSIPGNGTTSSIEETAFSTTRLGARQLTKVREMDRELVDWINGLNADNKLDELTREMINDRARQIAKEKRIIDFAGTANWYTRFLGRNFSDSAVSKQLKVLSFVNPGKFMEDFDPERSAREMRKMNRRIYRENVKKNQMYDETGRLLDNSKDSCDCLDDDCPGCHFPCPKCGSEKCGTECRCNRKWVYEVVEIEGTNMVIKNPSLS